ncbi:hypothetical protein LGR51_16580 [Pseudomonas sp. NP21570]|jgi:hypothetical protein|uniref:hypothetical protein n=1 Tax=Pseudomonas sp. TaxID=306 RepID=UPI001E3711CF|nr:hypothetical protein [Pseudomonas sp.]MCB4796116.1 hypothetical protein [Pseudomonas sp. NP21570]
MSATQLQNIIIRDLGQEAYEDYSRQQITNPDVIAAAAKGTLSSIPPMPGHCVMISAGFVAALRASGVTAFVILGDLLINGKYAFRCYHNLPNPTHDDELVDATWGWACLGDDRRLPLRPVDLPYGLWPGAAEPSQLVHPGALWNRKRCFHVLSPSNAGRDGIRTQIRPQ